MSLAYGASHCISFRPDPGSYACRYINTAACRSSVSYIDGDKGILRYRGYPIEELAEKSSFLEVSGALTPQGS